MKTQKKNKTFGVLSVTIPTEFEVAACPFCGGTEFSMEADDNFPCVTCENCEAIGPTTETCKGSVEAWNKRK